MSTSGKRKSKGSKASDTKRKRKYSGSDEDGPAFLSGKYVEPPSSKIYNSHTTRNKPAELFRMDLISAMKIPDSEFFSKDEYCLIDDPWKTEWERGVQVPVYPEYLPESDVRILRKRNKEMYFKMPKKLIHATCDSFYNPKIHDIPDYFNTREKKMCHYDMDEADVQWLLMVNQEREDLGLLAIEETLFEEIIEEFEGQSYVNFQEAIKSEEGLGVEYDEDAICDVCRSPDSLDNNELVFCDACNICIHQMCYGINKIPEGSWICRTCALGIRPACALCPNRGGAMKTTRCGQKWVHVGCALWIPEATFIDSLKMEPIKLQIPANKFGQTCALCSEKTGVCISCSAVDCNTVFHVTCAFNADLHMQAHMHRESGDNEFIAYCESHRSATNTLTECEDEQKSNVPRNCLSNEKRSNLRLQKIKQKEAEFYNYVHLGEIKDLCKLEEVELEMIFNYWILKRKANSNRPLLTPKVEPEALPEDDTKLAMRKKLCYYRQNLERVRNLVYMVRKREKHVKNWILYKQQIFLKQYSILKKYKRISEAHKTAVLNANLEDLATDKKYARPNGPSPNIVSVLSSLVGAYVPKHDSKSMKMGITKRDKGKPQPNPYAKHYLNGLLKRSQRFLLDKDRKNGLADHTIRTSVDSISEDLEQVDICESKSGVGEDTAIDSCREASIINNVDGHSEGKNVDAVGKESKDTVGRELKLVIGKSKGILCVENPKRALVTSPHSVKIKTESKDAFIGHDAERKFDGRITNGEMPPSSILNHELTKPLKSPKRLKLGHSGDLRNDKISISVKKEKSDKCNDDFGSKKAQAISKSDSKNSSKQSELPDGVPATTGRKAGKSAPTTKHASLAKLREERQSKLIRSSLQNNDVLMSCLKPLRVSLSRIDSPQKASPDKTSTDTTDAPVECKPQSENNANQPPVKRDIFKGYRIPKKLKPIDLNSSNSVDKERGNVPLSPLPDIPLTKRNRYQSTKVNKDQHYAPKETDVNTIKVEPDSKNCINLNGIPPSPTKSSDSGGYWGHLKPRTNSKDHSPKPHLNGDIPNMNGVVIGLVSHCWPTDTPQSNTNQPSQISENFKSLTPDNISWTPTEYSQSVASDSSHSWQTENSKPENSRRWVSENSEPGISEPYVSENMDQWAPENNGPHGWLPGNSQENFQLWAPADSHGWNDEAPNFCPAANPHHMTDVGYRQNINDRPPRWSHQQRGSHQQGGSHRQRGSQHRGGDWQWQDDSRQWPAENFGYKNCRQQQPFHRFNGKGFQDHNFPPRHRQGHFRQGRYNT